MGSYRLLTSVQISKRYYSSNFCLSWLRLNVNLIFELILNLIPIMIHVWHIKDINFLHLFRFDFERALNLSFLRINLSNNAVFHPRRPLTDGLILSASYYAYFRLSSCAHPPPLIHWRGWKRLNRDRLPIETRFIQLTNKTNG